VSHEAALAPLLNEEGALVRHGSVMRQHRPAETARTERYSHVFPDARQAKVRRLDDLFVHPSLEVGRSEAEYPILRAERRAGLLGYPMSHPSCLRRASGRVRQQAALLDRASAADTDRIASGSPEWEGIGGADPHAEVLTPVFWMGRRASWLPSDAITKRSEQQKSS
jgi:hypothetical protein